MKLNKYCIIIIFKNYNYLINLIYYLAKELISKYNYLLIRDFQIISLNQPIILYCDGRYIAQGEFYGGLIFLSQIDLEGDEKSKNIFSSKTEIFNKFDYSPIISLIINNSEDTILAGTYIGSIIIYDINRNIKHILNYH